MAVSYSSSSEKGNTEEGNGDFQLPSKRRKLKKVSPNELDIHNMSGEVEIVGLGEANQKPDSVPANVTVDRLLRVKEEIYDQEYGSSNLSESKPVSRSDFFFQLTTMIR